MIAISVHIIRLLITFQKITIRIHHKLYYNITIHIEDNDRRKENWKDACNGVEKIDKIKTNLFQFTTVNYSLKLL